MPGSDSSRACICPLIVCGVKRNCLLAAATLLVSEKPGASCLSIDYQNISNFDTRIIEFTSIDSLFKVVLAAHDIQTKGSPMDIRFQTKGAASSPMVADHVRRRLDSRLSHRSDRVEHVEVRLGDTESGRVHHDMYCLMQVHLIGTPVATVIEVGTDMYATIDRAVDRVGRLTDAQLGSASAQPAGPSQRLRAIDDLRW